MVRRAFVARSVASLFAVVSLGVLAACGSSDSPAQTAAPSVTASSAAPTSQAAWPEGDAKGTLANPYRIGEEIVDGDWSMTIDSVNLSANDEVKAMGGMMALVDPDPGNTWVTIHATWKYNGDQPDANGGTMFELVPANWSGDVLGSDTYGTSANDISTLSDGADSAAPVEKGFSDTGVAYIQAPVDVATDQAMIVVAVNYTAYNYFLVAVS